MKTAEKVVQKLVHVPLLLILAADFLQTAGVVNDPFHF
jgi:hypothetical protein